MNPDKKQLYSWAMYDWANSAYTTAVMAGFFPIFFKEYYSQGIDPATSTAWLGVGNALASLVILLMAPILGAIADVGSLKKRFLLFFAVLGICMTAALSLIGSGQVHLAIALYALSAIGFSGANIFYDSLLTSVSEKGDYEKTSSLGYALGYLGGGLLFLLGVLMVLHPETFGLESKVEAIQTAFLLTALWWLIFSLPLLFYVKETPTSKSRNSHLLTYGFKEIKSTLSKLKKLRMAVIFLIAYWFYIDGVDTIAKMAVDFALNIGLDSSALITALLIIQFLAFPATLLTYKAGLKIGVKCMLYILIGIYFSVVLLASQMSSSTEFYLLAVMIALAQGGLQALSRSLYARITPAEYSGEFFGFYNMFGKFAAILGPVLIALSAMVLEDIRWSVLPVALLFFIGAYILSKVNIAEGEKAANDFVLENKADPLP